MAGEAGLASADLPESPGQASWVGLVLVGGASRRMRRDKATLPYDGRRLGSIAVQALSDAGISTVVTVGHIGLDGAQSCEDVWPGEGPLGGIVSGLRWAERVAPRTAGVVVLACDLPFVDADAVRTLLDTNANTAATGDGVLGFDGERPQPLFSILRSHAFPAVSLAFNKGARSPMEVFKALSMTVTPALADGRLSDVDTPEQLAAAQLRGSAFTEIPPISG